MCSVTLDVPLASAYAVPLGVCLASGVLVTAMLLAPARGRAAVRGQRLVLWGALGVIGLVSLSLIYQARASTVAVKDDMLVASSLFVTWEAPLSSVAWQSATDARAAEPLKRKVGTSTGGVQLGRFVMQDGGDAFVLRTGAQALWVPVEGAPDLILGRTLYEALKACAAIQQPVSSPRH